MEQKKETRGRKPIYPQDIDRWYNNEFKKLQYSYYSNKITKEQYELKKKELLKEKTEKEIDELKQINEDIQ
jgi:hypothetical protein